MSTPEGNVKKKITALLKSFSLLPASQAPLVTSTHTGWFFMPVSNGMGVTGIADIIGHYQGRFFCIETKTEKKNPTPLQQQQLNAIEITGAKSFVVHGENDLLELTLWLESVK